MKHSSSNISRGPDLQASLTLCNIQYEWIIDQITATGNLCGPCAWLNSRESPTERDPFSCICSVALLWLMYLDREYVTLPAANYHTSFSVCSSQNK